MSGHFKSSVRNVAGNVLLRSSGLRRLTWRLARSLYCLARGEQRVDDMLVDGELDLQRRVVAAYRAEAPFIAFDVGANQGDWTLSLIESFEAAEGNSDRLEAHVFEPIPATRERLIARLDADRRRNVRINDMAASNTTGTIEMIVLSDSGGTNSLVYDEAMKKEAKGFVSVPLTTLDLYCAEHRIERVHIVKCDTEGHDLSVLRGAIGMLRSGRIDVLQFEYNHRWVRARAFLKDVFDLINGLPYHLGRVMPSSVELFDHWNPELEQYWQSNYVLLGEDILPHLEVICGSFDKSNTYAY